MIVIIGTHPILSDLVGQYTDRGDSVMSILSHELDKIDFNNVNEVFLLSRTDIEPACADNEVMGTLEEVTSRYNPEQHQGRRLLCHVLLQDHSLLYLIQHGGMKEQIEKKLEVYPFTMDDLWSQKIAFGIDWEPITIQSEKTVHLLIFGMAPIAELTAINTAQVAHFPNYIRKHSLRTRITVVDEKAYEKSADWIMKYRSLFENCHYRLIDTQKRPAVTHKHIPAHKGEDYVDVEWEFVTSTAQDSLLREKIRRWSKSDTQLLTIVYTNGKSKTGGYDAMYLPDEVCSANIPVYVYMQNDKAFQLIKWPNDMAAIRPFGMLDRGYDINLPLVQMAKTINYVYKKCRAIQGKDGSWKMEYVVEVDNDEKEELWKGLPSIKRFSSIYNAMTIGVKMRSIGLPENDWEKFYDISQQEIELLSQVEHNRWCVEELILGWRPCDEKEQAEVEKDIHQKEKLKERKIHYDLRPYNDLRPDASGKPTQIYDRCLSACLPLIAKISTGGTQ